MAHAALSSDTPTRPATNKRVLGIIFFTVFMDLIGFGIIIPIQPFFAETLGASPTVVTLLGASFSLMQFLFAPFWGRLSDRFGRRPVMLTSIGAAATGYLLFGMAETLTALFVARMLAGLGSANIGTAQAMIADSTTPQDRARGMGLIGVAFGLGFIFGPALGGLLGQFGLSAPAYVAALCCGINGILAFLWLPETLTPENRARGNGSHRSPLSIRALKDAARHPNVPQLFALYLLYTTAFSVMEQVLALFIEHAYIREMIGVDIAKKAAAYTTYYLLIVGFMAALVQGGLIGRLVKTFGERKLLIGGTAIVSLSFIVLPFAGHTLPFFLFIGMAIPTAFGTSIINPSLGSLLSQSGDRDEQGGLLGLGQSLAALGRVIGPTVAGALFQANAGVPFWTGGVIAFGCTVIALSIRQPEPSP